MSKGIFSYIIINVFNKNIFFLLFKFTFLEFILPFIFLAFFIFLGYESLSYINKLYAFIIVFGVFIVLYILFLYLRCFFLLVNSSGLEAFNKKTEKERFNIIFGSDEF